MTKKTISLFLAICLLMTTLTILPTTAFAKSYADQLRDKGFPESYISKLVSLHNGKIYIESTECQGSTVRIILPKEKEQFKNFTLSVKDKKTFYEPDVPTVPLKLAGELRTEDNDKLHRILIVEDNDELRNYLFQSFSPIYNVQVCNNGKEALTIVKQFWPGLILSDIMMPEMRGDELCIHQERY